MPAAKFEGLKAMLLFLYVLFGNAATIAIVRHLISGETAYHAFQIVFMASFVATILFIPWLLKDAKTKLATGKMKLFSVRAVLEFLSFSAAFYAVAHIPLPMQTAILFITPIFATIITILVLKEHGTWVTFLCVAIGFGGMLIITHEDIDFNNFNIGILYAFLAAIGFAFCGTVIKFLTRTESSKPIAFYMVAMTSVIAAPFAIANWQMPTAEDFGWFVALGVIAYTIQVGIAAALSKLPFITLIPLNFMQLVFVSILAYLIYDEAVSQNTVIGSVLILVATLANSWHSARHAKEMAATEDIATTAEDV